MKHIFTFILWLSIISILSINAQNVVITGSERTEEYLPLLRNKRVALVINQTSTIGTNGVTLLDSLLALNINVTKVFAPEHGFRGNADAGEQVKDGKDIRTGKPILSLYGANKKPSAQQLNDVDILVFDIQDVGARFYTYISTLFYVMEAAAEQRKEVIVLDRPNPCDYVQGPILKPAFRSFVGMLPIPLLHGCTVGELAKMINGEGWINKTKGACLLTVVPCLGWQHQQPYSLPIKPSPNLPNDQAIKLYPSLCPFEATKVSIGRGTTYPFQVIGALGAKYGDFSFTPVALPGYDKNPLNKNKVCYGVDLRKDREIEGFDLAPFINFYNHSAEKAAFFDRPRFFDLLMGTDEVRKAIVNGKTKNEIEQMWQKELEQYRAMRSQYLIYE